MCRFVPYLLAVVCVVPVALGLATTSPIEQPKAAPRVDALGDPLPAGAVARLGTRRFQVSTLPHEPISIAGGKKYLLYEADLDDWSRNAEYRWLDAASGKVIDRWKVPAGLVGLGVSADGKWALLYERGVSRHFPPTDPRLHLIDLERKQEVKVMKGEFKGDWGVGSAIFSADAKWFAVVLPFGRDKAGDVHLWDAATGKQIWMSPLDRSNNLEPFEVLGFTPGKPSLVLRRPGIEGRIVIVDPAGGKIVREFLTGHRESGIGVDYQDKSTWTNGLSPDGVYLVRGRKSSQFQVWDLKTGKELPVLTGHDEFAGHFAFAPDGRTLVTASAEEPFVLVRDWPEGKVRKQVELGRRGLRELFISADNKTLNVLFDVETMLHRYDLETGKALPVPADSHRGGVIGLALAPDGALVSLGRDKALRSWDLANGRSQPARFEALTKVPYGFLRSMRPEDPKFTLSADGKRVAIADILSGSILLIDRHAGKVLRTINIGREERREFCGIALSPDGRFMAAGTPHGLLSIWDVDKNEHIATHSGDPLTDDNRLHHAGMGRVVFSSDGKYLAETKDSVIQLWKVDGWKLDAKLTATLPLGSSPSELAFSSDGRMLACADYEAIVIWEMATRKARSIIAERERPKLKPEDRHPFRRHFTSAFCSSPDGRYLAVVTTKQVVEVWDVFRSQRVAEFSGHEGRIEGLTFTRDGKKLVTGSRDGTLLVWSVEGIKAPATKPLKEKEIEAAWEELASTDAATAFEAIQALVGAPEQAVARLRAGLSPVATPNPAKIKQVLADLDNDNFNKREIARKELEALGDVAQGSLREFLAGNPPIEARRRAEKLLADFDRDATSPDRLRQLRAVEALEHIANADARTVLRQLAKGAEEATLTREAAAALRRLESRR